jgi:hypothetical protein
MKYPRPKMMGGEGNEGTDHWNGKQEEKSSRDEEPSQEKEEDKTPTKAVNSQGKSKGGSDRSDPAYSSAQQRPLSFPQRVSCFIRHS